MPEKKYDIKHICDPLMVKALNKQELLDLAADIRTEIIEATARNGGHLSSNLGVVELTLAIHRAFDICHDKILFDVGHQSYTHKILTGRQLDSLRTKNGTSGFQKRAESAYDAFEAGHSSTSISAAQGMALARDLNKENYHVVAVIGDASISSGMAFEALNNLGMGNNKVIIILNDNDMSIGKPVGALSRFFTRVRFSPGYLKSKASYKRLMFRTKFGYGLFKVTAWLKDKIFRHISPSNIFEQMGFGYLGPINGHNFKALDKALKEAQQSGKSIVVHVRTIKGKGYAPAENDRTGYWHGVTPFVVKTGLPKNAHPELMSWSHLYADLLKEEMGKDRHIYLVNPATGKGSGLEDIFNAYPTRCHDVGIAEEHAVTMASGLALAGQKPVISIYSTFLQRAFDQVSHDVARQNLEVTFLIDRAGLVGSDGETHQGLYDESFLIGTPNMTVTMASDPEEAAALLKTAVSGHGPFAIRYPRDFIPKVASVAPAPLIYGKWTVERVSQSHRIALITFGPILNKILTAVNDAELDVQVINAVYQKPLDRDMLQSLVCYDAIVLHDAYATPFGFVNSAIAMLISMGYKGKIIPMAIADEFIKQATIQEQMDDMHVNVLDVLSTLKTL